MKLLKNLSNLQKRIIGAGMLLIFGIVFFADLFNSGDNYLATGIYYIFSTGIIWELFSIFFKSKIKWSKKKIIFFILSLVIYLGALVFINKAMYYLSPKIPEPLGAILLITILLVTITTDIGAYFIGKKFGKKKLAPKISPNKTWAGFFGGLIFTTIITTCLLLYIANPFGSVLKVLGVWYVVKAIILYIFVFAVLSIIAQLGDLFESYLKRLNGVKDSGKIIIGHGGLLDRFDSFLFLIFWIGIVIYIFGVS